MFVYVCRQCRDIILFSVINVITILVCGSVLKLCIFLSLLLAVVMFFCPLGVKLNVSHYNVALRVQLENGQKFKVAEFLAEMEKNTDIIPNRVGARVVYRLDDPIRYVS